MAERLHLQNIMCGLNSILSQDDIIEIECCLVSQLILVRHLSSFQEVTCSTHQLDKLSFFAHSVNAQQHGEGETALLK